MESELHCDSFALVSFLFRLLCWWDFLGWQTWSILIPAVEVLGVGKALAWKTSKTPWGKNEHTDLAVGSQLRGPKSVKVIALHKLLTWFIFFTKKC